MAKSEMRRLALKLVADDIAVATESFARDSFFAKDGPVKLWFGGNFTKWIRKPIPEPVPAFQGTLRKTQLAERMYDSQIVDALGQLEPFTIGEFAAIIRNLLMKQPEGQNGLLLSDGCANIFYVVLEDARVVAVYVRWFADGRQWDLYADDLDDVRWDGGDCVFSRS